MSSSKPEVSSNVHSFEAPPTSTHPAMRRGARLLDSVRLGLTVLALLTSIVIVGTTADTIEVYNTTRLGEGHFLSMWPNEFDIRPTIALVTCGSIILVSSVVGLIAVKVPAIASKTFISTSLSLLAPSVSLIAALISTSFFYVVNVSSTTFTLRSWTCQWADIEMDVKPHWGTLCRESKVAIYLSVMMIPLQLLVLGTVVLGSLEKMMGWVMGRKAEGERKASPALS